MKIARFILPVLLIVGCSPRIVEKTVTETKVEYRDRVVHDTTTFTVEKEVEKIVTRDTSSHLENRWAKSDASVSDGLLTHSLESKPQVVEVPYEVTVTDTLYITKESQTITKEVPRKLNRWQRFSMAVGRISLLALALGLLALAFRGRPGI